SRAWPTGRWRGAARGGRGGGGGCAELSLCGPPPGGGGRRGEFEPADDVDGIIVRTDQVRASIAAEARFEARKMGTSYPPSRILATLVAGTRWKLINMRKSAIFGLAGSVPATEALPVALASHLVFADQTPRAVVARVAAWGAEGVVLVLDRHLELRAAAGIATIVTDVCFVVAIAG